MFNKKKMILSVLLGVGYWLLSLGCYLFYTSNYGLFTMLIIPLCFGLFLGITWKDFSLKTMIFHTAIILFIGNVILVVRASFYLMGKDNYADIIFKTLMSFLYVAPIQLIFIVSTWSLVAILLKRGNLSQGKRDNL